MPNQDPSAPFRIRQAVTAILRRELWIKATRPNPGGEPTIEGVEDAAQAVTEFILAEYADGPGVTTEEEPEEGYITRGLREARSRTASAQEETGQTPAPEWAYRPNDPEGP